MRKRNSLLLVAHSPLLILLSFVLAAPVQAAAPTAPAAPAGTTLCTSFSTTTPPLVVTLPQPYPVSVAYASCNLTFPAAGQTLSVQVYVPTPVTSGNSRVTGVLCKVSPAGMVRWNSCSQILYYMNLGWNSFTYQVQNGAGAYILYAGCMAYDSSSLSADPCSASVYTAITQTPPSPPSPPPQPPSPPSPPAPPVPPFPPSMSTCATINSASSIKQYYASSPWLDAYASCTFSMSVGQGLSVSLLATRTNGQMTPLQALLYLPGYVVNNGDPTNFYNNYDGSYQSSVFVAEVSGTYTVLVGCMTGYPCSGVVLYNITSSSNLIFPPPAWNFPPQPPSPPLPPLPTNAVACPAFTSVGQSPLPAFLALQPDYKWNAFAVCSVTLLAGQVLTATLYPAGSSAFVLVYPPSYVNALSWVVAGQSGDPQYGNAFPAVLVAPQSGAYSLVQGCNMGSDCSATLYYSVTATLAPTPPLPPQMPYPPNPPSLPPAPPLASGIMACSTPFSSATSQPLAYGAVLSSLMYLPPGQPLIALASCNITVPVGQVLTAWIISGGDGYAQVYAIDYTTPAIPWWFQTGQRASPSTYVASVVLVGVCLPDVVDYGVNNLCGGQIVYTLTSASYPPPSPPSPPMAPLGTFAQATAVGQCAPYSSTNASVLTSLSLPGVWDTFSVCTVYLPSGSTLAAGTNGIVGASFSGQTKIALFPPNYKSYADMIATDMILWAKYSAYFTFKATTAGVYSIVQGCQSGTACSGTVAYSISPVPSTVNTSVAISGALSLSGYNVSSFGTAQANAFKSTVATAAGAAPSAVFITSVSPAAAPTGRHLAAAGPGVTVGYTVVFSSSASATVNITKVAASLGSVTAAAFQSAGLTACTSVVVAVPATSTTLVSGAAAPTEVISTLPVTYAPPLPAATSGAPKSAIPALAGLLQASLFMLAAC